MCGRYTLIHDEVTLRDRFNIEAFHDIQLTPRFNIAPSQNIPTILFSNGEIILRSLKWGFVPSWVKDLPKATPLINARAETVVESFKRALTSRRYIIPVDGFYEWKKTSTGKIPMRIRMKHEKLFGIAGLWEQWKGPDDHVITSCSIITVPANALLAEIHDRMPAILTPDIEQLWLDPNMNDSTTLMKLLIPYANDDLEVYRISTLVNSTSNDLPECIVKEN